MDDKSKTRLLKELKAWCNRVTGGMSEHEKNKHGPKIGDAAQIFISQNRYRVTAYSATLKERRAQPECNWKEADFDMLEFFIETLQDEIEFLRTVNG